jgi:FHA domain/Double zinc ribbon
MKTCPKCGGENLPAAIVCRLCDTEIPRLKESAPAVPPPQRTSGENAVSASPDLSSKTDDKRPRCPGCQTAVDPEWPFCQHCGYRLIGSGRESDLVSQMKAALPISQSLDAGGGGGSSKGLVGSSRTSNPVAIDAGGQQHAGEARQIGLKPVSGSGSTETGPQLPGRHSERNLGLTTSIVCASCGSIQPAGGAFCADCGAQLSPEAIARALSKKRPPGRAALHLITDGGQVGQTYRLEGSDTVIGRAEGDMTFPHDNYMSVRHARIVEREGRYFLIDEGSRNGSFIRIGKEIELEPGDTFLVGKQVLRFETK